AGLPAASRAGRYRGGGTASAPRSLFARTADSPDATRLAGRARAHFEDPRHGGWRAESERRDPARDRADREDEARLERSRARSSWEVRNRSRRAAAQR